VNGVEIVEGAPIKDILDIPRIRQSLPTDPHSEIFPEDTSLFIGDLSRHVSEDRMREMFSKFGEVEDVDIKRDKVTRNNLGYGFVTFKNRHQAEQAKRKMHGMELGGRTIRVGWAQKNTNLFVGDLDPRIDADHLKTIFKQFGPIYNDDTFVKRNGYGFVKFKHRTHAEKAKATLDGKYLLIPGSNEQTERPIRIGWGDANTQRNCVHVQFDSMHGAQVDMKESDFCEVFQQFGHVVKVSLPRFPDRQLKGYGFIHFEENDDGEEAAARAITTLSFGKINGVTIQCNFGKRQNQRHKRFNKHFQPNQFDDEIEDIAGSQLSGNEMNDSNNVNVNANYGYLNNSGVQGSQIRQLNGDSNGSFNIGQNRSSDLAMLYGTSQNMLDQTTMSFPNPFTTNVFSSSLTQFNSLPPGPHLAPPAMYGKTLDALAGVSPGYVPFSKQPSPSPGMLSPPNLPTTNNLTTSLSPPNPINQSASNMFLQLSALNQLANGNNTLPTNLGLTNGSMQPTAQATNFASLITLLPPTSLPALHQSLSPNWKPAIQGLNSVASLPSVNNTFTNTTSTNGNKSTSIPQSNAYGNFPLNLNMNGLFLSPPNLPGKESLLSQR
jgi:RNA recognition motif-containing protein